MSSTRRHGVTENEKNSASIVAGSFASAILRAFVTPWWILRA